MTIGYDDPIFYDDSTVGYDGDGGATTSTAGGSGKESDPWWYGVPLYKASKTEKEKAKRIKEEREAREREEEKNLKEALRRLAEQQAPKKKEPVTFEEIVADALGEDGAELLMMLLD